MRLPLVIALALTACGAGHARDPGALTAPARSGCADRAGWPMRDLSGEVAAWACPGAFPAGGLAARCAPGWSPCRRNPIDQLGCMALADLPSAYQRGFYASSATGWAPGPLPDPRLECASWSSRSGGVRVLFGCGPLGVYSGAATCGGFRGVVACSSPGSSWTCGTDLGSIANADPLSGVLCCPAP